MNFCYKVPYVYRIYKQKYKKWFEAVQSFCFKKDRFLKDLSLNKWTREKFEFKFLCSYRKDGKIKRWKERDREEETLKTYLQSGARELIENKLCINSAKQKEYIYLSKDDAYLPTDKILYLNVRQMPLKIYFYFKDFLFLIILEYEAVMLLCYGQGYGRPNRRTDIVLNRKSSAF